MPDGRVGLGGRVARAVRQLLQLRVRQFRRWLESTSHIEHLSVLVFAPLLIALVTVLSNSIAQLSFLLFPPLASGTYTLFADPEGKYSDPVKFVGGMTLGAFIGWLSLEVSAVFLYDVPPGAFRVHAGGAALGIFVTGLVTWLLDLEEPTAFSTALLVLITGTSQIAYIIGVAVSSAFVAAAFHVWREMFYEERARYLYSTTSADDHVLVPMCTEDAGGAAMLGARLAAAHEAGKVVLLDLVDEVAIAEAERAILEGEGEGETGDGGTDAEDSRPSYISGAETPAEEQAADWAARELERQAAEIETKIGVPCEVVVAVDEDDTAATVVDATERTDCDLVVAPFEGGVDGIPEFIADLFATDLDVIAFRQYHDRTEWERVLVPIRRAGDLANAMMDYAQRLAGVTGTVSACSCIEAEAERRSAERMLADVVEVADTRCETRVSRSSLRAFLERNDSQYDLVMLGSSTDRSGPSRLLRAPTYEEVSSVETDLAIVHHG